MNARTIQHPGIEINEIDMTEYRDTVTTNNAYVIGFTDRGPIYDYSWITTRSEFINLYGEPQNEAEKYLYYAVQSILNNGGTPIVARMPYDNKQCKAYKGLKIRYAAYKEDPNSDTSFILYNWDNDQAFASNAQPLIELDKVGQYLNSDGFDTVKDTLINQDVELINYPTDYRETSKITYDTIPTGSIANLTYRDLLFNLAPNIGTEFMLDIKGSEYEGEPDGTLWDCVNSGIIDIAAINAFIKVDAHPESLKTVEAVMTQLDSWKENTTGLSAILTKINNKIEEYGAEGKYWKNINDIKINVGTKTDPDLSGVVEIFNYYKTIKANIKMTEKLKTTDSDTTIPTFFTKNTPLNVLNKLSEQLNSLRTTIIQNNALIQNNAQEGLDTSTFSTAKEELNLLKFYINAQSTSHDKHISGVLDVLTTNPQTVGLFTKLNAYHAGNGNKSAYYDNDNKYTLSGILSEYKRVNPTEYISGILNVPDVINTAWTTGDISGLVKSTYFNNFEPAYVSGNYYQCTATETTVEETTTTTYNWNQITITEQNTIPTASELLVNTVYKYTGEDQTTYVSGNYYQCTATETTVEETTTTTYNWNQITITEQTIMPEASIAEKNKIYKYIGNENEHKGVVANWINVFEKEITDSILEQNLYWKPLLINGKYPSGLLIPETIISSLANEISSYISSNIGNFNPNVSESQKEVDKALALIYNDPYFKRFDGTPSGQAIVDAHLLMKDEIAYKNGVYLDSKECSISNEQYDDLVTTNNFTKADSSISKYGEDIDNANFVIVDKHKTIVDGVGSNEGYFVTIIDPYDALKSQRLLVNPCENREFDTMVSNAVKNTLKYYGDQSAYNWKVMFKNEINTMNTLQRVKNADGIWVGEPNPIPGKEQLLDSWSVPLTGDYRDESISKSLMNLFPQIPLTDVAANASSDNPMCTIDKQYSSHIVVAVCKTNVNPSDGKITVSIIEQFFGSLFDEKNVQNGRDLYIGNIINANSNYIEFYRNNYVKPAFGSGYDPAPYNKTAVPQFFIKDSAQLNNACKMVGIDPDLYDVDNVYFTKKEDGTYERKSTCPALIVHNYKEYIDALAASNIFIFNKKTTILYNNHPQAEFTSFSKKESQKIIANTTGLFGQEAGTTANIGDNFIIDMDRCISFIKNVDDIPIYFVADAGLSTIAQFCDNVVWDQTAMKWVTQNFDPDNDPDQEDRYITGYEDVATWRKIVDKLDQISREVRRDCMTIIDAPRQLTLDGAAPKIRRSRPQNTWDDLVGNKLRFISGINSSYCAGYYNWLRTTDEFSGRSFWLPPTCKIIGNYMYLNIVNLPWLAPAGLSYGVINGIHGISHNPDPNEEDQIYLKSWNYIKQYPYDGFIIEGQKTTLTKNSAFNRVNVRTLFLDLERFVYNVARNFKYQVNNSYTREQFVQTIKPKFEDYMIRGGLYDYLIKCDDTNNTPETIDANELRCAIYLKPARLIEFILIDMVAAKTGANFDEIVL